VKQLNIQRNCILSSTAQLVSSDGLRCTRGKFPESISHKHQKAFEGWRLIIHSEAAAIQRHVVDERLFVSLYDRRRVSHRDRGTETRAAMSKRFKLVGVEAECSLFNENSQSFVPPRQVRKTCKFGSKYHSGKLQKRKNDVNWFHTADDAPTILDDEIAIEQ
jgi:hypothetical protein